MVSLKFRVIILLISEMKQWIPSIPALFSWFQKGNRFIYRVKFRVATIRTDTSMALYFYADKCINLDAVFTCFQSILILWIRTRWCLCQILFLIIIELDLNAERYWINFRQLIGYSWAKDTCFQGILKGI